MPTVSFETRKMCTRHMLTSQLRILTGARFVFSDAAPESFVVCDIHS